MLTDNENCIRSRDVKVCSLILYFRFNIFFFRSLYTNDPFGERIVVRCRKGTVWPRCYYVQTALLMHINERVLKDSRCGTMIDCVAMTIP